METLINNIDRIHTTKLGIERIKKNLNIKYDVIDYCITFRIATLYRKLKFACQVCSNGIADILCSIYFEIIELHFCNLDRYLKRAIIIREEDEKPRLLQDMNESMDSDNMGLEDDKD